MKSSISKPWILPGPYFAKHEDNRMQNEGDLASARKHFLTERPYHLDYLLRTRFAWMAPFIKEEDKVVEFGSGTGLSKEYLPFKNLILTDVKDQSWIDKVVNANDELPFAENSLDSVICSYMIHHLAYPAQFLKRIERVLKPGGYILINEVEPSLVFRLVLRLMCHEGWSYEVDPYNSTEICNDPKDPWSANVAIPTLMFDMEDKFYSQFPNYKIIQNTPHELFIFLTSGGVSSKTIRPPIPKGFLPYLEKIDQLLIKISPKFFAITRRILIQKRS